MASIAQHFSFQLWKARPFASQSVMAALQDILPSTFRLPPFRSPGLVFACVTAAFQISVFSFQLSDFWKFRLRKSAPSENGIKPDCKPPHNEKSIAGCNDREQWSDWVSDMDGAP
jgi:hypothetical protein